MPFIDDNDFEDALSEVSSETYDDAPETVFAIEDTEVEENKTFPYKTLKMCNSIYDIDKTDEAEETLIQNYGARPKLVRHQQSSTDSEQPKENVKTWKKLTKQMILATKLISEKEEKKQLKKMWKENYAGMCNRAIVLDKVIGEASIQGIKIKPIVMTVSPTGVKNQEGIIPKKKKYIGLGKKFYGFCDEYRNELSLRKKN